MQTFLPKNHSKKKEHKRLCREMIIHLQSRIANAFYMPITGFFMRLPLNLDQCGNLRRMDKSEQKTKKGRK